MNKGGRFVIATPEQVEEAYRKTLEQFGLLRRGERIVMWPKQQAIVWIEQPKGDA